MGIVWNININIIRVRAIVVVYHDEGVRSRSVIGIISFRIC